MKKKLFVATALIAAAASFSSFAYAAPLYSFYDGSNGTGWKTGEPVNVLGVPANDTVPVALDVTSSWDGNDYKESIIKTASKSDFTSKATLDMTNVAKEWNAYIAEAVAKGIPKETVLETVKVGGEFTLTIAAPSNIDNATLKSGDGKALTWGGSVLDFFDQGEIEYNPSTGANTITVTMKLKDDVDNTKLDEFYSDANTDKVWTLTVADDEVRSHGAYTVTGILSGSVTISGANSTISTVSFDTGVDKTNVALVGETSETAKPAEQPTAGPDATAAPTPAATDLVNIVLGDVTGYIPETLPDESKFDFIKVDIDTPSGAEANFGSDYTVSYNNTPLTEDQYNNLINGYDVNINGTTVNIANDGFDFDDIVITTVPGTKVVTTPVYEKDGKYETADGLSNETTATAEKMTVTVETPEHGTITVTYGDKTYTSGDTFEVTKGDKITVVASPESGYRVKSWDTSAGLTPESNSATTTTITVGDLTSSTGTIGATFSRKSQGGGGGGSRATAKPTATATVAPDATSAPKATATPIPSDKIQDNGNGKAKLNYDDHYAYIIGYPSEDGNDDVREVRPENSITRAEVATIFFRMMTDDSRSAWWTQSNDFSDVNIDDWFNNAISTAANADIVNGYDDGTFKPNNAITRAEFATIAARFSTETYSGENKFNDIAGHWAAESINKAADAGWITGYDDGSFRPDQKITRAEAMTLINRLLYRLVESDGLISDMVTWSDNNPSDWYYANVQEATNSHNYSRTALGYYETWTALRDARDWEALEKSTSKVTDAGKEESVFNTSDLTAVTPAPTEAAE